MVPAGTGQNPPKGGTVKIAVSADHRGFDAAQRLADRLNAAGHEAKVFGDPDGEPCDYPERAFDVGTSIASGAFEAGVLICGTGIGMSIAANKVDGIRAAVVHDELTAQLSRSHNDANVICLSADLLGHTLIEKCVEAWLGSEFEGGRHARRLSKITAIERGENPAAAQSATSG